MKILQICTGFPSDRTGGIENSVYALSGELRHKGNEVKVLCRYWNRRVADENVIQIRTPRGEIAGYAVWMTRASLRTALIQHDVLHCHGLEGHIICSLPFVQGPIVLHIHNTLSREARYYDDRFHRFSLKIQQRGCGRAAKIITPTATVKRDVLRHLRKIEPSKIEVIPHFVDLKKFNPRVSGQAVREKYGLKEKTVILYFGKIKATKGLEDICKAFRHILKKRRGVSLLIAGMPTATTKFLDYLQAKYPEVVYATHVPDEHVREYYAAADIYCIYTPGFAGGETFAITLAEAMGMGKPIVCSDNPVFREVTKESAVFAPPNDPARLAEALIKMVDERRLRETMATKSREMAEIHYDPKKVVSRVEDLYRDVLRAN